MRKISRINPTPKSLLNMALNLRDKFNKPTSVEIEAWGHRPGHSRIEYKIYVEGINHSYHPTYKRMLEEYDYLMSEEF